MTIGSGRGGRPAGHPDLHQGEGTRALFPRDNTEIWHGQTRILPACLGGLFHGAEQTEPYRPAPSRKRKAENIPVRAWSRRILIGRLAEPLEVWAGRSRLAPAL